MAVSVVLQQLASAATSINGGTAGSTATRAFTQVTVAAGDRIAVQGRTEDGWAHYTSVAQTAGTAAISALTRVQSTGTQGATCANDLFTGTVTTGGTLTLTATITVVGVAAGATTTRNGATLLVATGAAATNTAVATAARQLSYSATAGSWLSTFTTDWTAGASSGASFVPAGAVIDVRATDGVDQQATAGANSSIFNAHWTSTSAGAVTYGLSSPSAGTYNLTLVEFTDVGGAAAAPALDPPRRLWLPGMLRRGPFRGLQATVSREAPVLTSGLPVMVSDGVGLVPAYLKVADDAGNLVTPGGMTTV